MQHSSCLVSSVYVLGYCYLVTGILQPLSRRNEATAILFCDTELSDLITCSIYTRNSPNLWLFPCMQPTGHSSNFSPVSDDSSWKDSRLRGCRVVLSSIHVYDSQRLHCTSDEKGKEID